MSAVIRGPVSDIDPFADDFLADPFRFVAELRDAGPAVYLPRYRVWAVAGHEDVHAVLRDHERFSSAAGVGLTNLAEENPWRKPSILLEWIGGQCRRAALRPDTIGSVIYEAADAAGVSEDDTALLIRSFLSAGVDTTGIGPHVCVGMTIARMEGEAVLGALGARVASWELTGEPEPRLNNTLRGLDTLPVRIHAR